MEEKWKAIPGYERRYEISNTGFVRSYVDKHTGNEKNYSNLLKKTKSNGITLYKNGRAKYYNIPKLVYKIFDSSEIAIDTKVINKVVTKKNLYNTIKYNDISWIGIPLIAIVKAISKLTQNQFYIFAGAFDE